MQQKGNKTPYKPMKIQYHTASGLLDHYHTGGNNTFQYGQVENALCLIWTSNNKKGLLFALYRIIRRQAAQHTTKETRRAHTANK